MKKRLGGILLITALTIIPLFGCGQLKQQKSEYDIDEFGAIYEETEKKFNKETEYLTQEEKLGDEGRAIYKKCSKETGLPYNKEITLRGKKKNSVISFQISSSNEEYSIFCFFDTKMQNKSIFIEEGENILVKGIFSDVDNGYGVLSNVEILSPEKIDDTYTNNVKEILDDYDSIDGTSVIQGEVALVQTLDEFENAMNLMEDTVTYTPSDLYDDTVVTITGAEGKNISFMYDQEVLGSVETGDKIAVSGSVEDLMSLQMADGSTNVFWGLLGNVYEIYRFE